MEKVACLDSETRGDLFRETAVRMGNMNPVIIEKDFWVCWLLKQLFSAHQFQGWLVFKGGTSPAKCFNLIQRFSEDTLLADSQVTDVAFSPDGISIAGGTFGKTIVLWESTAPANN